MPNLKVMVGSDQISLDTDVSIATTDKLVYELLQVLARFKAGISGVYDISVTRTDPGGIFSYEMYTSATTSPPPDRIYRQTWFFDVDTQFSFGTVVGKWTATELIKNIDLRLTLQEIHTTVGLEKLTCKW